MKKMFVIVVALVIIAGGIFTIGAANHSEKNAVELVGEAYLVNEFGNDDYKIDISKIEDETVYFYWSGDHSNGYTHTNLSSLSGNS